MKITHFQGGSKGKQRACYHSGNRGVGRPECARGHCTLDPFTSAPKTSGLSYEASASRFPGAVTRTPHALERMSNSRSTTLHCKGTPTLCGWRSPPSHEDAGQSPNDPSTWKPIAQLGLETVAMCGEGFSPKHGNVIAGREKAACASDVPADLAFGLSKRRQQLIWPGRQRSRERGRSCWRGETRAVLE